MVETNTAREGGYLKDSLARFGLRCELAGKAAVGERPTASDRMVSQ